MISRSPKFLTRHFLSPHPSSHILSIYLASLPARLEKRPALSKFRSTKAKPKEARIFYPNRGKIFFFTLLSGPLAPLSTYCAVGSVHHRTVEKEYRDGASEAMIFELRLRFSCLSVCPSVWENLSTENNTI
jgi:hypothetical protein